MGITWDAARKLKAEWDERQWNSRKLGFESVIKCPSCKSDCDAFAEATEWDTDTLGPLRETALLPEAYCEDCGSILVDAFGTIDAEPGCPICHMPLDRFGDCPQLCEDDEDE